MFCPFCGAELPDNATFCPVCGRSFMNPNAAKPKPAPAPDEATANNRWLIALLLCFFLGFLGIHRFYVGKTGTGIAMLLTLGGISIWWLIDLIMILLNRFTDSEGKPLK